MANRLEDCKRRTAAMANFTMVADLERALAVVEAVHKHSWDKWMSCLICSALLDQKPHNRGCPLAYWEEEAGAE